MSKEKRNTRVIRITEAAYREMKHLKHIYEQQHLRKFTHSELLGELNKIAKLLTTPGNEVYDVNGVLYRDRAKAWGEAVQLLVKGQHAKPYVYLSLGFDDAFDLPVEI